MLTEAAFAMQLIGCILSYLPAILDGVGKFAVRFDTMRPWLHVLADGRGMPMC